VDGAQLGIEYAMMVVVETIHQRSAVHPITAIGHRLARERSRFKAVGSPKLGANAGWQDHARGDSQRERRG
jgi:hypothetical protein